VACGQIEAMVDPEVSLWDIAPMPVVIGEAGGTVTALDGSAPDLSPGAHPSCLATNGRVHTDVVAALATPS
jgi:histidinol-phosphatase